MATAKFKVQLLETTAALITAAFGLVAALAWNEAIKAGVAMLFPAADQEIIGLLIYALIVTILAVVATLLIARALGKAKDALKEEDE